MNKLRYISFVIVAVLGAITLNPVYAGENLNKKEIIKLLSGNTVNGYYVVEALQQGFMRRVGLKIKFFNDGSAEKTTAMASRTYGQFTEKGKWFVNKKGKLCFVWASDHKKRCGRLKRTPDGKYELHRKNRTFFFEELVAGN